MGRDLFSRILWGGRMSLGIGIAASGTVVIIALLVGGVAGYWGGDGRLLYHAICGPGDELPNLLPDAPPRYDLRPSVWAVIVVIAVFAWAYPARIFRFFACSISF